LPGLDVSSGANDLLLNPAWHGVPPCLLAPFTSTRMAPSKPPVHSSLTHPGL
jgi:hypothetical protein